MIELVIIANSNASASLQSLSRARIRAIKIIPAITLVLILISPTVKAAWTGISLSIEEIEDDWAFENSLRLADTTRLNMHFEEKTRNGIRVGANIGRLTTRISNKSGLRNTEKFDASYIGLYLAYPVSLSEHFILHNQIGYQYHSGSATAPSAEDQISWSNASYLFGLSFRFGDLRIMPFAVFSDISGDIEREDDTETFDNDVAISSGLSLDLFVDSTSYVRLKFSSGSGQSFSLRFAREF